jgi:hypothetical protein
MKSLVEKNYVDEQFKKETFITTELKGSTTFKKKKKRGNPL